MSRARTNDGREPAPRGAGSSFLPPLLATLLAAPLALCVGLPVAVAAAADEPEEGPPSIAVLRFENPLANPWWSVDGIRRARDLLVEEIQASGRFAVLDRATLDARMQEEKLLMPAGQLSPAAAVKLGRVLGIDYLVTGSLSEYGAGSKAGRRRLLGLRAGRDFTAELSLRVVDGATGRLVWADGARHAAGSSGEWANTDPAAVDAAMFEPLLAPLLRDLVERMLATELEAAAPEPMD